MHELKETVTGEQIVDNNGAANTSGVGPANKPTSKESLNPKNQARWEKTNEEYKPLFANYSHSEADRSAMLQRLHKELKPVFSAAFYSVGEGALLNDAEDYLQDIILRTMKKLDRGDFIDVTHENGSFTSGFDNFRSYVQRIKEVAWLEADDQREFIEKHVPVIGLVEDEDGKEYPEDNTVGKGPDANLLGDPIEPEGPPDEIQLRIWRSQDGPTKALLENWVACDRKAFKLAKLMSTPGNEVSPNTLAKQVSRALRKIRVEELAGILKEQFGEDRNIDAAEEIVDYIDLLPQHYFADYPITWADVTNLAWKRKVRRVKEDAAKSYWWRALRHLYRLWAEKSGEYTTKSVKIATTQREPTAGECIGAFKHVMGRYQEVRVSPNGVQALNYERACTSGQATPKASSFVRPSNSDFICDVEISANRCLTEVEFKYFNRHYKSCSVVDMDKVGLVPQQYRASAAVIDRRMRLKLGARFIQVGISPFSEYVREVDVRKLKPKTKSKYDQADMVLPQPKEPLNAVLKRVFCLTDKPWPSHGIQLNGTYNFSACADDHATSTNSIADRIEEYGHAITAIQLAEILQCSRREIYKLVEQGRLPALRLGTMIRLDPWQVGAWVRSKMTTAA